MFLPGLLITCQESTLKLSNTIFHHSQIPNLSNILRRMRPNWALKVKEGVENQIKARFLIVIKYPEWVANTVLVPKKDGRIRVCVDFQDLNKASPKDDFPLLHIDVLVDNTTGHKLLSFMDRL